MDTVNHPSHYTQGPIEVIDYITQVVRAYKPEEAFLVANAIKYISRAPHKGTKEEDIAKALWYLKRLSEGFKTHG